MRFTVSPTTGVSEPAIHTEVELGALVERIDEPLAKMMAITSIDLDRLEPADRSHMLNLARQLAVEAHQAVAEMRTRTRVEIGDSVDIRDGVATSAA